MRKYIFLFILLISGFGTFVSGQIKFTADAPDVIVNGDKFRLTYTINTQNVKEFRAPSIPDFDVLMGPMRSQQQNMQINGTHMTSTSSITFTYTLMATKEGTFKIPGATITADGKHLTSNAITIKVLPPDKANGIGGNHNSSGNNSENRTSNSNISGQDVFVTATASRTTVYEQEAFLLTYKIYTRVNITSFGVEKMPDFQGFHSQEIDLPRNARWSMEHYNGRNYQTSVYRQFLLFPQQTGKLEIAPTQFEASIAKEVASNDPLDAFFNGGSYVEVKKKLLTSKITINVNPLPANKPASFSGGVGEFNISSTINTKKLKTNDALTIKLIISGIGNMKLINTPEIAFPKDFEVYDPKIENKFSTTVNGLSGNKVIEYLAIPRHPGKYKIPPVEFSFFDIKTKNYKTLKTEEYEIEVEKGSGNASQTIADFTNKEDLKVLGKDIRYIKTGTTNLNIKGNYLYGSIIYYLWYIIPLCLFITFVIIYRKKAIENANAAKIRTRKANKIATKRMKYAGKLLNENKKDEFYDEILKALWGYISDKMNIPVSRLSKDNIEYELTKYGVVPELINEFTGVLNECEFARYAPGEDNRAMDKIYSSAIEIISKMENSIKH